MKLKIYIVIENGEQLKNYDDKNSKNIIFFHKCCFVITLNYVKVTFSKTLVFSLIMSVLSYTDHIIIYNC